MLALAFATLAVVSAFGVWALVSTRSAGKAETQAAVDAKDIETLKASNVERAAALLEAKETIRALNVALADFAAKSVGPVSGAHAELFKAVADANRSASGVPAVPAAGASSNGPTGVHEGDDGLLKPGE